MFDDSTWISAELRLEHSELLNLLVTVSGSRYSIAECGQQLVWLGAAIQIPIDGQTVANCTCRIESQDEMEWFIHYSLDNAHRNMSTIGTQIAPIFRDSTIIQGFPTQKRPALFVGLELGLALLLECIYARWPPVFENGRIILRGFDGTLEVVKRTQNIWLWHIVHPSSTSCSFSECSSRNEQEVSLSSLDTGLQIEMLAPVGRHIIANPEYLGIPVVNIGELPWLFYDDLNIDKMYLQALLWKRRWIRLLQRLKFQALRHEKISVPPRLQPRVEVPWITLKIL